MGVGTQGGAVDVVLEVHGDAETVAQPLGHRDRLGDPEVHGRADGAPGDVDATRDPDGHEVHAIRAVGGELRDERRHELDDRVAAAGCRRRARRRTGASVASNTTARVVVPPTSTPTVEVVATVSPSRRPR